ncbi:hypothetical protein ACHAWU_008674 [Discostella pseudostelligera]|uniref:Amino acid transporter n=1 Tax=Discostella pseudostelligera TaxID=259834 RepID=A0ABD3M4U1_9STRA
MASDTFPNLSEPLLPPAPASQQQDDDDEADCESQSPTQASTIASTSRVASSDEADAAGGIDPLLSSQSKTKMNGFVLAVILFFNASGGPFGIEPSLKAAGNLYAIIGFAAMPMLWSLPEAIMTYELSTMFPCASGGVRFTEEAFGEIWGLLVGYLGWISGVAYNASLPILFLSYVNNQFFPHSTENWALQYGILVGITVILTFVNYRGLEVVGGASVLIFFLTMAPFVILVIIGIPNVDTSKWLQTPSGDTTVENNSLDENGWFPLPNIAGIALRPFINNLYWNFNGFDQASHYSTTVSKKTLRNGIAGSLVLVSSAYLIPILVITGATNIEQNQWNEGSFATAGTEIGGRWLGNWIVFSSGVSLLAQFFSEMAADSMGVQGLADRGHVPSIFRHQSPYNTPTYAMLLGLVVILAMLPFSFSVIIELSNFSYCLSITIEFLAFGQLMIRRGESSAFRKTMYAMLLMAPLLFNVAVILLASYATYIYIACVFLFGILLINARRVNVSCCNTR